MDKDSADLAQAGLSAYTEVVSPIYEGIRERLAGSLSANHRAVEGLQVAAEHADANRSIVEDFIDELLPTSMKTARITLPDGGAGFAEMFMLSDAAQVRMIQANAIWRSNGFRYEPYFIVGKKLHAPNQQNRRGSTSDASLLLIKAAHLVGDRSVMSREYGPPPITVETWSEVVDAAEHTMQQLQFDEFTPDELARMFLHNARMLVLGPFTPGSVRQNATKSPFCSKKQLSMARREVSEGKLLVNQQSGVYHGISDNLMVDFDVLHYLNRLAVAFGKTEKLEKLLDKYAVDRQDPDQALIDS